MQKQAPSVGRILVMVLFALSCFGLLLFLWVAFGGSTPLSARGYRVTIPFREAGQLAQEADVRISGVPVGRVKSIDANPRTGTSDVVVELKPQFAPIPRDTRAMLRQKTLLGETYVELTPGRPAAPDLPDGGTLPPGNIAPTVELDEILRTFDAPTRAAFEVWQQQLALAGLGRGRDLNDTLAQLAPLEEQATALLGVLNRNEVGLSALVRNTGAVSAALSARRGQLASLIRATNTVFATTAARDRQLAATFVALPTFQRESQATLNRLVAFAHTTSPLVEQLKPVAQQLDPTMQALDGLAPELASLLVGLGKAQSASVRGFPAVDRFLKDATPFISDLSPALTQLNPVVNYLGAYPNELTSFFANTVASTNAASDNNGSPLRYLRTTNPLGPEGLAVYPRRVKSNRNNAYPGPNLNAGLAGANLPVYDSRGCVSGIAAPLDPSTASILGQTQTDRILQYAFINDPLNVPAPGCRQQGLFDASGQSTQFPHVAAAAQPSALRFPAP